MSFAAGQKIVSADIVNQFVARVVNVIKSGTIDSGNVGTSPYYQRYVVNPAYLSNWSTINTTPSVGNSGNVINASTIYNAMVSITSMLLRVGTYSYSERYGEGSGYTKQYSVTGKALFNPSAYASVATNLVLSPVPGNGGVAVYGKITIDSINSLITNCLNSWNSSLKPHCETINYQCHTNCHTNCHENCHSECYSHENQGGPGSEGCYWNGPWAYGDLEGICNQPATSCHTNEGTDIPCHIDSVTWSLRR